MPRRRFIALKSLKLEDVESGLPRNVFPIRLRVKCSRTKKKDPAVEEEDGNLFKPPHHCFPLKVAEKLPYIPARDVWIVNPLKRPNLSKQDKRAETHTAYTGMFPFEKLSDDLSEAYDIVTDAHPPSGERIYLSSLELTAIPDEYVTERRDGTRGWKRELYEDEVRVPMAYFDKVVKIPSEVRKELRSECPSMLSGKTLMPLRLTKIKTVVTKMRGNPQSQVKRNFYTEKQADRKREVDARAGDFGSDCRPKELLEDDISLMLRNNERAVKEKIRDLEEVLVITNYKGEFRENEEFEPESVRVTSLSEAG